MYGCYILAGGKSSRMGEDKAFVNLGALPMIKHQVDLLRSCFVEVVIVTNSPGDYRDFGCPLVSDVVLGMGPLGGVYTALEHSKWPKNFIIACDMPFPNLALIRELLRLSESQDVVVVRDGDYYEPLFAVYDLRCRQAIQSYLGRGGKKITGFYREEGLRVLAVDTQEARRLDADLHSFFNINTRHELAHANALLPNKRGFFNREEA